MTNSHIDDWKGQPRGVVPNLEVHGHVVKGFESVREAFLENFSRRKELGAACCVYRRGEKVVDLWGGIRNKATGEPWEEDTMAIEQLSKAERGLLWSAQRHAGPSPLQS